MDERAINISVDAAYHSPNCTYAVVINDAVESLLEAQSGTAFLSSVLEAECQALLEALQIVQLRVFTSVTLVSDSLMAVQLFTGPRADVP